MNCLKLYHNYLVAEKRYSLHTSEAYLSDIKQFESYLNEVYQIQGYENLNPLHLRSWFASLSLKGMQPRSIRRKISSLNTFFKFLKKRDLIKNNPISKVISPKVKKRLPVTVRESDLKFHLMDLNENNGDYNLILPEIIIQTLYTVGIRRSELIHLKVSDVHLNNGQLKVMGKGGKERIIPFGKQLSQNLERYLLVRNELKVIDADYLFLLPNGKKLYPKMVYLMVNKWLKKKYR